MLVAIFTLAAAVLWKASASPWAAISNGTNSSLPVVDLDYTLQQASSLNVGPSHVVYLHELNLNTPTGFKRIL